MQNCIFLLFNYAGGKAFDSMGPIAPYLIRSALSIVLVLVAIIMVIFGGHLVVVIHANNRQDGEKKDDLEAGDSQEGEDDREIMRVESGPGSCLHFQDQQE